MGPEAYVTPSWYATKQETGKVVPTWNYIAVHAYGPVEFFQETERLLDVVTAPWPTSTRDRARRNPGRSATRPPISSPRNSKGIVGLRIPVDAPRGQAQDEQNRPEADRIGVAARVSCKRKP